MSPSYGKIGITMLKCANYHYLNLTLLTMHWQKSWWCGILRCKPHHVQKWRDWRHCTYYHTACYLLEMWTVNETTAGFSNVFVDFLQLREFLDELLRWHTKLQSSTHKHRRHENTHQTVFMNPQPFSEFFTLIVSFLSASLYVSKRGAYWDRLCRDVVGWLVVGCNAHALWPNGAS